MRLSDPNVLKMFSGTVKTMLFVNCGIGNVAYSGNKKSDGTLDYVVWLMGKQRLPQLVPKDTQVLSALEDPNSPPEMRDCPIRDHVVNISRSMMIGNNGGTGIWPSS